MLENLIIVYILTISEPNPKEKYMSVKLHYKKNKCEKIAKKFSSAGWYSTCDKKIINLKKAEKMSN